MGDRGVGGSQAASWVGLRKKRQQAGGLRHGLGVNASSLAGATARGDSA
jgi:hypothetical protein